MTESESASFVAECFWPGVKPADLEALDGRAQRSASELRVRYLGSILMRDDEVVLCQFEGTADAVHEAARQAGVPFERILETSHSPWPSPE